MTMTDKKPTFGQKTGAYVPVEIDPDDIWIKTFKVGETRIRLLEPVDEWITYREHYDPSIRKSFPCTEDTSSCIGCQSSLERVRQRPRKYAFNALDDKGRLNLYKMGAKLKDRLKGREQRQGTLLDRDYTVIRTGTTMDNTEYDYEYSDRYEIKFDEELYDIQTILSNQYLAALEVYGSENSGEPEDTTVHDEPVAPKKAAEENPNEPVEDWPLSRLKAYASEYDLEVPARASRSTLVSLVEEHVSKQVPF